MSKKGISKKKKDNDKKNIIIISVVVALLIIFGIIICYMFYNNQKQVSSLKKVKIEAGMSIDKIKDLIKKKNKLSDDVEISFKRLKDNESIKTQVKYYKNGKEVPKEEAVKIVKGKEVLKKGYIKKEKIVGVGKYEIIIKDNKNNTISKTTMTIKDTKKPNLILQDVEIEEGTAININNFIKSCTDNSNEACNYEYTDEKGSKIDNIDLSVGERKINIVAIDSSKNRSGVKTANLKVNAKPQEQSEVEQVPSNNKQNNSNSYDTSNPIVAKALSLVGSSMDCTRLVEAAIGAVGKDLWRKDIPCTHPIFSESEFAGIDACGGNPNALQEVWGINVVKHFGTPVGSPSPGDVLFYDNGGTGGKHVAIYIGNGQAVHGGWKGNSVVINSINVPGASSPRAYRM